ncbi:phage-associated protein, partial [human gut metagenome]
VYNMFSSYQYNCIDINYEVEELDKEAEDVLNYVINNFAKYDSKYLEKLSHEQEPWIMARSGLDPDERSDKTISKESISNYFINEVFQPEMEEWD